MHLFVHYRFHYTLDWMGFSSYLLQDLSCVDTLTLSILRFRNTYIIFVLSKFVDSWLGRYGFANLVLTLIASFIWRFGHLRYKSDYQNFPHV
jgi:hypothetical protein